MKRAFLIVTVVLLAVLMAGCDNFVKPEVGSNVVGYTDDGRAIVELELGVGSIGNAKALHATLAKAASDFYEVIFYDGTNRYRTSWREGRTARLRLPVATYSGATNYAYIFAGRYDDMMLLGVGTMASHDEYDSGTNTTTPTAGFAVTANTVKIDFEIEALTTNVTTSATTSTFKPGHWATGVFTPNTGTGWQVETIKVSDEYIPVFMLPANNTGADAAAFDITCTTTTLLSQIVYSGEAAKYISKPYAWLDSIDDLPIDLAGVTFLDTMTLNAPVMLPIHLQITTAPNNPKGKGGLCLLGIEVPVLLKTDGSAANGALAKTWYLKGGLNNSLLDMGYDNTGMGGAVLIGSGNVLGGNGIVIGGVYP